MKRKHQFWAILMLALAVGLIIIYTSVYVVLTSTVHVSQSLSMRSSIFWKHTNLVNEVKINRIIKISKPLNLSKEDESNGIQKPLTIKPTISIKEVTENTAKSIRKPSTIKPQNEVKKVAVTEAKETSTPKALEQRCNIPIIDPFHREAMPYVSFKYTQKCEIKYDKTSIKGGNLVVDSHDWDKIEATFFKRNTDNNFNKVVETVFERKPGSKDSLLTTAMKTDFFKVEFNKSGKINSEWRAYPVKRDLKPSDKPFQTYKAENNKFNILMIMLDSFSHGSAQRYLPKTYKMLERNPNSVILKGHTIVGDATTPQLSAMLFGAQPENIKPEGRRGYANAGFIDSWPSILKDYRNHGYATLHSEDSPYLASFNFRLMGFNNKPTVKYLRPWWQATSDLDNLQHTNRAPNCPAMVANQYLRDFYKEYNQELSFSLIINAGLTHGTPEKAYALDDEFVDLFDHLNKTKKLDSTIVVLFGDHGSRTKFRETWQGKLEHRLPFMALTFPPRFSQRFPDKMKILRQNSQVLTTFYDMHVTLKHLLSFSEPPPTHKFGRSLFTDIVNLNRDCAMTGVPSEYCICTKFVPIPVASSNSVMREAALQMVTIINEELLGKVTEAKDKCSTLSLDKVTRIMKVVHDDQSRVNFDTYEIAFVVQPGGGMFEGTFEHDKDQKKTKISKAFSRINVYGDKPKCIAHLYPHLRPFCYCKS